MTSFTVHLLDPRAQALLKNLEELDLIRITPNVSEKSDQQLSLQTVVDRLRKKAGDQAPSLEEITSEVESVRQQRRDGHE
jgi:hypothetical protein